MITAKKWERMRIDLRQATLKLQQSGYPVEYSEDENTINIRINPQSKKTKVKPKNK